MKTAADVLDETLGVLDPVEQELKSASTKKKVAPALTFPIR